MRYILIILVFLSVGANAQMVIKAHANYRPFAQPAANLLLDDYPNAAAAYSLRKLDKDYTGAAIRVRKDTTGQPEQDIFFVGNELDTAALKSFLNARSGFVTTWYDQSGNARNATQSTQANQPRIANLGVIERQNGKVSIRWVDETDRLINNGFNQAQPLTTFMVAKNEKTGTDQYSIFYDSYNNTQHVFGRGRSDDSPNEFLFLAGGTALKTASNTNFNLFYLLANQASSKLQINNATELSAAASIGANNLNGISIGNLRGNPSPIVFSGYIGLITELVIYGSNQSTNKSAIQNNINDYYNIYWNGDFTGILDTYPNSAAAYSLRNLSSTYTGPLIRVRKDTTGQPEMDIYGDYYGNLDTVGLKSFLNARSGFVTTWYDQSGNGRNASQSTQANQPRIANLGVIDRQGTRPTVLFDGSNDNFDITGFAVGNVYSLYYAQKRRASGVRGVYLCGNSTGGGGANFVHWSDNNIYLQYFLNSDGTGSRFRSVADNTSTFNLLEGYKTSTTQNVYKNNTELVLSAQSSFTSGIANWNSIGEYSNSNYSDGNCSEIILYSSDQLSNRSGIATNINSYYSIY